MEKLYRKSQLASLLWLVAGLIINCFKPRTAAQQTFSYVKANAYAKPGEEVSLIHHNATGSGPGGVITHWWFAHREEHLENTLVRIYVDEEKTPGVEAPLTVFAGTAASGDVGRLPTRSPYGSAIGGSGSWNSVYSTLRIPFMNNVRMSVVLPQNISKCTCGNLSAEGCCFWSDVHGVDGMQVGLSDVTSLPYVARLRVYTTQKEYQPYDIVQAVRSDQWMGAVVYLTMSVDSVNFAFAQGCFRAFFGDSGNGTVLTLLTSGMAENFLSFNSFDSSGPGEHAMNDYTLPEAGMTHKNVSQGVSIACYRWYGRDPIIWKNGFRMEWQIGAYFSNQGKCAESGEKVPPAQGGPAPANVTMYTFTYEWQ